MRVRPEWLIPPILAAIIGAAAGWHSGSEGNEILFMNVGQGDCTVLISEGAVALVDVGPKTPTSDAGERVVVPELGRYGLEPSIVLLTHPDTDHVGGLSAVQRAFPNIRVLVSREFRSSKHMLNELREAGVPESHIDWLPPHLGLKIGSFDADVFCPPWRVGENDNEGSIVMRVSHGRASALLMGDAGFRSEASLSRSRDWSSQVLKVGHHGSRFSTSTTWLAAVKPTWAVVSCGRHNRYGHPAAQTLQRLQSAQVNTVRTDEAGDLWFKEGSEGFDYVR